MKNVDLEQSKKSSVIESLNKLKNLIIEKGSNNTFILIKKTFQDLMSLKRFLITLFIMMLFPLIFLIPGKGETIDYNSISTQQAASAICIDLVYALFFWTLGVAFISIIGNSGASLIAEEVHSGTMLILISKPISRIKIFLGKYIGLFLYGALLSFSSLIMIGWIAVLIKSGNIQHFFGIIPFLFATYIYSLFLLVIFVSITMALSSIMKRPRNASLVVLFIAIFSFLGMMLLKMFITEYYEEYGIYHFDLGYHLANIYVAILEMFDAIPPVAEWQSAFASTTGVYENTSPTDPDQDINPGGMTKQDYYLPIFSFLLWIVITIVLLLYGLWSLKKREISV